MDEPSYYVSYNIMTSDCHVYGVHHYIYNEDDDDQYNIAPMNIARYIFGVFQGSILGPLLFILYTLMMITNNMALHCSYEH